MADAVLGQIFDWIYGKLAGFFSEFFEMMNMMGACCFSKRMRKVFKKNEKSMLQFCNKNSKKKRAFTMG